METLRFRLDGFEGPLDLMLHLIQRHKLDIYDVEITRLLDQYLDFIEQMQAADLEIASEFLAMAARLVYIKTMSLLPQHEEETAELKRELEGQLLEYHLCKLVAQVLRERCRFEESFSRKPQKLEKDGSYRLTHPKEQLREAYLAAVGKAKRKLPPPRTAFNGIVSRRIVTVESRIFYLLDALYRTGEADYQALFLGQERSELVATFLAMLELVKSGRIRVSDDQRRVYFNRGPENSPQESTSWK